MHAKGSFAQVCAEFSSGAMRGGVVGVLCVLMAAQPLMAAAAVKRSTPVATGAQIQGEQRVLHALNRLTFGPRPGDVQAVQAMGLDKWFEQQLNPQAIDDSSLQQRLAAFPAMQMSQEQLAQRYPSPQVIRQIAENKAPLPSDPTERAIYEDQIAFYKMKKQADEQKKQVDDAAAKGQTAPQEAAGGNSMATAPGMVALPGDGVDPATPGMPTHEEQFYSGLEAVKIINLPPDERMKRILAMKPKELVEFRKSLSGQELAALTDGLSPEQRETLAALQGSPRVVGTELLQSRLIRDAYTNRQLEAVMTDFWLNHFNVYVRKNQNEPYLLASYERDVIRANALGNFEELLVAVAHSPAMLVYLDNWQSIGPDSQAVKGGGAGRFAMPGGMPGVRPGFGGVRFGPMPTAPRPLPVQGQQAVKAKDRGLNENYARELMELHTLGVQCEVSADRPVSELPKSCGQGYTQKDVTEVAKVLTGWTIDRPLRGGEFQFEPRRHEPGSKTVMGRTIEQNGEREGLIVLHMLASSPATAEFISRKLAVRFVSDTPPQALVERMAKSFEQTHGDIKAVLRTMFNSPEFWSPEVYRAKVKTPLEFVLSAVRASDAEIVNAQPLVQTLDKLGMPLYGMQTPNGYNWTAEPWVNTSDLVNRMNFALVLSGNRLGGTRTDWVELLNQPVAKEVAVSAQSPGLADEAVITKEAKLETLLLGQPVSEKTRETVLTQFNDQAAQQEAVKNFSIRAMDPELMAGVLPGGSLALNPNRARVLATVDPQAAIMAGLLIGSPEFQRR